GVQPPGGSRDRPPARGRLRAPPRAASSGTEPARTRMTPAASVPGDASIRLFCALRLPEDVLDGLVHWGHGALPEGEGVRRVVRPNLHVTLAFLGRRPAVEVQAIAEALREAAASARP